ncbi:MAG: hypothetical protein HDQ91_01285 [Desulfovibrio sp.]|nr:hypothetical protein [Desulfovibrio sp.]
MTTFKKIALATLIATFCASAPVLAADAPATPDASAILKSKADSAIEKGKAKLAKELGLQQNATQQKSQDVQVTEEKVTVETPQGTASETTVTVTPETPAAPDAATAAPAAPEAAPATPPAK